MYITHEKEGEFVQQISDYELALMKIIWANNGTALYAEIVKSLEDKGTSWTKNTIITLTSRLIEKGFLKTSKIGRKNEYRAIVSAEEYQASQAQFFVNKIYDGNAADLVATLIEKEILSPEDLEQLKSYWNGGESSS